MKDAPARHLGPCSLLRRMLAMAYDALVVIALLIVAGFAALPFTDADRQALKDPGLTLYFLAVWFLYLGLCWRRAGATPGMRAWRIRLTTPGSVYPGWGRCLLRFAASLLSAAAAGGGFLWALTNRDRLTWHDLLSDTRLVVETDSSRRAAQHQDRAGREQQ